MTEYEKKIAITTIENEAKSIDGLKIEDLFDSEDQNLLPEEKVKPRSRAWMLREYYGSAAGMLEKKLRMKRIMATKPEWERTKYYKQEEADEARDAKVIEARKLPEEEDEEKEDVKS